MREAGEAEGGEKGRRESVGNCLEGNPALLPWPTQIPNGEEEQSLHHKAHSYLPSVTKGRTVRAHILQQNGAFFHPYTQVRKIFLPAGFEHAPSTKASSRKSTWEFDVKEPLRLTSFPCG